jgi:hypothetical protein
MRPLLESEMADRFDPPDTEAPCKPCWLPRLTEAASEGISNFISDNQLGEVEYDEKKLSSDLHDLIESHTAGWGKCTPCAEGDRIDEV